MFSVSGLPQTQASPGIVYSACTQLSTLARHKMPSGSGQKGRRLACLATGKTLVCRSQYPQIASPARRRIPVSQGRPVSLAIGKTLVSTAPDCVCPARRRTRVYLPLRSRFPGSMRVSRNMPQSLPTFSEEKKRFEKMSKN